MGILKRRCIRTNILLAAALAGIVISIAGCSRIDIDPGRTWAVIVEQNFYPSPYTPLDVDWLNTAGIADLLVRADVPEDQILILKEGVSRKDLERGALWLESRAAETDTVIFYIFSHGPFLGEDLSFTEWFPPLWNGLETEKKVLIVDTCYAAQYLKPFLDLDRDPGFLIGSSDADELSWCGLEKEGLPVIGSAWLHYFLQSLQDPASDMNGDRIISLREAFSSSVDPLQDYMMNTVYAVPEFLEGIHEYGIYPEKLDGYPNPVFYSRDGRDLLLYKLSDGQG